MHFLIDEDVDAAVGSFLAGTHRVDYARVVFGIQTKDPNNVAWARAKTAILITADKQLARSQRQRRRCAVLFLRDLGTHELERVAILLRVIETEASIMGDRFWMEITTDMYVVAR